ncbi:hypothetical protein DBV39_06270 [Orrella marina]|uniref:Uncharacterized protein n=1 Tax=Orrella marina TaxID=2163011 RepID=A0A2R4XHV7_9BURK|nr:hypothetical protein DBV39_06270 [Orrella marina]
MNSVANARDQSVILSRCMVGAVLYFAYTTDRDLRGCDCLRSGEVILNSFYSRIGPIGLD